MTKHVIILYPTIYFCIFFMDNMLNIKLTYSNNFNLGHSKGTSKGVS
jgi:hypothetical protein